MFQIKTKDATTKYRDTNSMFRTRAQWIMVKMSFHLYFAQSISCTLQNATKRDVNICI